MRVCVAARTRSRSSVARCVTSMSFTPVARAIIKQPSPGPAVASVLWLHGLGDTGAGWADVAEQSPFSGFLQKGVRFTFPSAPLLPVTLNGGMRMPSWCEHLLARFRLEALPDALVLFAFRFDIASLSSIDNNEDLDGLALASAFVESLVDAEVASGVPRSKVFVAGFSQGGAVALDVLRRSPAPLGGVLALSTWLCGAESLPPPKAEVSSTPIFMAHGRMDQTVQTRYGVQSAEKLKSQGFPVEFRLYDMAHSACAEELAHAAAWLDARLKDGGACAA